MAKQNPGAKNAATREVRDFFNNEFWKFAISVLYETLFGGLVIKD